MRSLWQIKDLVKNLAKEKGLNAQVLLRNYMMERLLERIALSPYRDNFILKGGMFISSLVGVESRSTVDMDTTLKYRAMTMNSIESVFADICSLDIGDGLKLVVKKIDEIRDEAEYSGYRVLIEASLESARIPLKVDITTGDEIIPKEMDYTYNLLIENRSIEILSYTIESVLAEKIETIITRGIANTRMRDFYDVYILQAMRSNDVEPNILDQAIKSTAQRRGSVDVLKYGNETIRDIFQDEKMLEMWIRYQAKYPYAYELEWSQIEDSVKNLWRLFSDE